MIEYVEAFGYSIWTWCIENKENILAFVTSGQLVSLIGALVLLVRNVRQVNTNTKSTTALNKTLENTNSMSSSINTLDVNFQLLKQENDCLRSELKETEEQLKQANDMIVNKLNAIIEVQSIVYSTIRDDGVRQTVSTILNNARYSEKNFKEELEAQIADLKETYSKDINSLSHRLSESIDKVSISLSAGEQAKNTMKQNNLRY